ncbi:MAG: Uma2 family endonuclease [Flammeovirgaceae bacterium]
MDTILEYLKSLPDALLILEKFNQYLRLESDKRMEFYNWVNESIKAEFINGEIIVHSPAKMKHEVVSSCLFKLLDTFVIKHDLGYVAHEKIMIRLTRNDYEPDICFFTKEKSQYFSDNKTIFPVPDIVVEVLSEGTFERDRGIKFKDYEAHGIPEYWIIDPDNEVVEVYCLTNGNYDLVFKSSNETLQSKIIPNFQIDIKAIFDKRNNQIELIKILSI